MTSYCDYCNSHAEDTFDKVYHGTQYGFLRQDDNLLCEALCTEYGSFKRWLDCYHPQPLKNWTKLFKRNFIFTGGEVVKEFLMSTGYLPGAHTPDCQIYKVVIAKSPAWYSR